MARESLTDTQPPENSPEDNPFAEFLRDDAAESPVGTPVPAPRSRAEARRQAEALHHQGPVRKSSGGGRRHRWVRPVVVSVVVLGLIGGGGAYAYSAFATQITSFLAVPGADDFTGTGTGTVSFRIEDGDVGSTVGDKLAAAGVVKSSQTFYKLLLAQNPAPVFQVGTYTLASGMSAQAALAALEDPANRVDYKVTIPEGNSASDIYAALAKSTGLPVSEFEAAGQDYVALGVPAEAPSIEGFLFPATYDFQPGQSATEMLQTMVTRMFQSLDAAGVATADRFHVVTLAALIQKEAGSAEDMLKVSRVFTNRLDIGMNLESDATVAYGAGHSRVATTNAERQDASNKYNTYANPGLPVGPIGNPGDAAINAALHPADGPWIFFVTINLETGETVFSETIQEHDAAVVLLQRWWADHPEYQ
jgi:UPF0755 protein